LDGTDAGNYFLTQPGTTANITNRSLTVTGITANNKMYDGTTNATLNLAGAALQGVVGADDVTLNTNNAAGAFADPNTGVNKTVQVSGFGLSGAAAGNYSLTQPAVTASITAATTTATINSSANPSPTGSNVTFTATLNVAPPGPGMPTGTVQFKADGVVLGSPATLIHGVASVTTAGLSHGTHTITAGYAGDGNCLGSTNALGSSQVINTRPVAASATYSRSPNLTLKISILNLITNFTSDADGDSRTLVSVGAGTNGASISISGSRIFYIPSDSNPNANLTDTFEYAVTDGFTGGMVTNRIQVTISYPNGSGQSANMTGITMVTNGVSVSFVGIPGYTYHVERTSAFAGSGTVWQSLGTTTADNVGRGVFTDTNAPAGAACYRTVWP
jgi:hypothetical protein